MANNLLHRFQLLWAFYRNPNQQINFL